MNKRDLDLIELALYTQAMFRVMERREIELGEKVDYEFCYNMIKQKNEELFKGE